MARDAIVLTITGVVQGVGFRPFVYRAATRCGLSGWVTNTPGSVIVHVEGDSDALAGFRRLLDTEAPPAARIARIAARPVPPAGTSGFAIRDSDRSGVPLSTIPPDIAQCALCVAEFRDPADRRHAYPFVNCTNCGPRFTIVRTLPYDRENTSMTAFALCPACRREYEDPADRRFHAEPNACPACGPRLAAVSPAGEAIREDDPAGLAAQALDSGRIVALRGLGGFQLAADATDDRAVRRLRERKYRDEKPFAVMVRDAEAARAVARLSGADVAVLSSPAAPILLLDAVRPSPLSPAVAPGLATVGIFLPYTPLHRLILDRARRPLVMTSGNRTDEPIATGNAEALARLSGIADLFLLHDREVVQRTDDSVVRRVGRRVCPVRRARGFVPAPVVLKAAPAPPGSRRAGRSLCVAGLGGELKSTFCILKDRFAYLSQHIGDLDQASVRDFYAESFAFFRTFLDARLAAACRDLHPGYFTTSFTETLGPEVRVLSLQHHKAHLCALLAETGFAGKAVGVAFDGTGYGEDGAVWGGEFFAVDGPRMERAASLDDFPLQGGDSSVRDPWKTAVSLLRESLGPREGREAALSLFPDVGEDRVGLVLDAIAKGVNVVSTSSAGRLFDGVAALAGVCRRASYEGQAPMLLESRVARGTAGGAYGFRIFRRADGRLAVDWRGTVGEIVADVRRDAPVPAIARRFHDTVADIVQTVVARLADEAGARHVLLSGGVFQNAVLLRTLLARFRRMKFTVLTHREVPANDGGISLGQAWYAANVLAGG